MSERRRRPGISKCFDERFGGLKSKTKINLNHNIGISNWQSTKAAAVTCQLVCGELIATCTTRVTTATCNHAVGGTPSGSHLLVLKPLGDPNSKPTLGLECLNP